MSTTRKCDVSLNTVSCEFPGAADDTDPGFEPIRTRCYSCGQRACRTCSKIQPYPHAKRPVRLCNDCVGEYQT